MPSPLGHTLLGFTAANLVLERNFYHSAFWLALVVFASCAADLDFLPGWFIGDFNRFHHGISHSVGMAFIFACLCAFFSRLVSTDYRRVFLLALIVYLSHLLGDYLGIDRVEPFGAPFLWPFSDNYYLAPVPLFQPIDHGNLGESSSAVLGKIFSVNNMLAMAVEVIIVMPLWALTLWVSKKTRG